MLNDYRQIIAGMKSSPWLITEESLQVIVDIVNMRLSGQAFTDEEIKVRLEAADPDERENGRIQIGGGVGVISMYGPMFPKSNLMTEISGATSLESFRNDLASLVENDAVKQIVLDMDTPGGNAAMVPETGQAIHEAGQIKPVYALANTLAASGGLWLGTQATKFFATESGKVGSLGVYNVIEDNSVADEREGRKVKFIHAGKFKTAGNPHEPLSAEAEAYIQEYVDELHTAFIDAVAKGRNLEPEYVRDTFGDAKLYSAAKATEIKMIDGIITFDELVSGLVEDNYQAPVNALTTAVKNMRESGGELRVEGSESKMSFIEKVKGGKHKVADRVEEAEKGHQDPPAVDDLPEPQRAAGDEGGDGGSRRDTPKDLPAEALVASIAEQVGLPKDSTPAEVVSFVSQLNEEVAPIREAAVTAKQTTDFATQYPEQAKRMAKLELREREEDAKAFAGRYERLTRMEDDKPVDSPIGFSARTLTAIEEAHLSFANREASVADLTEILDSIAETGLVDYSTKGSARFVERHVENADAGKAFSQCVEEVMTNDNLDYGAAVKVAAQRYPAEFSAYREKVGRGGDE